MRFLVRKHVVLSALLIGIFALAIFASFIVMGRFTQRHNTGTLERILRQHARRKSRDLQSMLASFSLAANVSESELKSMLNSIFEGADIKIKKMEIPSSTPTGTSAVPTVSVATTQQDLLYKSFAEIATKDASTAAYDYLDEVSNASRRGGPQGTTKGPLQTTSPRSVSVTQQRSSHSLHAFITTSLKTAFRGKEEMKTFTTFTASQISSLSAKDSLVSTADTTPKLPHISTSTTQRGHSGKIQDLFAVSLKAQTVLALSAFLILVVAVTVVLSSVLIRRRKVRGKPVSETRLRGPHTIVRNTYLSLYSGW